MFTVKFLNHSEITEDLLHRIIEVKTAAWPYDYDDQKDWIKNNLKRSDIHVLLSNNEKPIAYMNLIKIDFNLDSIKFSGFGIGNVCALEKGKGWGKELLISVNSYLKDNQHIGILFCKQALVKFYSIHGWILIENEKLVLKKASENIKCMISNNELNFEKLEYPGELF